MRDLKARYVGSTMGFFWSVVFPIINLFVFMFVFRFLLKARWDDAMGPKETGLIMLAGILVWASFAETLSRGTNCLVENSNLIQKVVFPSEILPVQLAISSIVNMLIGMPIVVIGTWIVMGNPFGWQMLALPLIIALQIVFTLGLGYFLATLNVLWRDTFHLVGVFTTVWMFATPIFYPASLIENFTIAKGDTKEEGYWAFGWMLDVNPMHWVIDSWRRVLLYGEWPEALALGRLAVVGVILFAIGATFFMRQKRTFPDLL